MSCHVGTVCLCAVGWSAGKYRGVWTGKQVISMIIPDVNVNASARLNDKLNPMDETIIIDRVRAVLTWVLYYEWRRCCTLQRCIAL